MSNYMLTSIYIKAYVCLADSSIETSALCKGVRPIGALRSSEYP